MKKEIPSNFPTPLEFIINTRTFVSQQGVRAHPQCGKPYAPLTIGLAAFLLSGCVTDSGTLVDHPQSNVPTRTEMADLGTVSASSEAEPALMANAPDGVGMADDSAVLPSSGATLTSVPISENEPVSGGGPDGTYSSADNGYEIMVKSSPGKLTVVEPNKTSVYIQRPGTDIYDFTNPTNGITYSLEVGDEGRTLHAFKPETPSDVTVLNRRGNPAQMPVAGVEEINIQGEIHYGVREVPGYQITGTYLYEGHGEPIVELLAGGTGQFQTHGMPVRPIQWWMQSYPSGEVKMNKGPGGQEHTLILLYLDRSEYDMVNLTIDYQSKQMAILGERFKPF